MNKNDRPIRIFFIPQSYKWYLWCKLFLMSLDFNSQIERVASKAAKVAELNATLRSRVEELEDQVAHLQETLTAMQAEHHDLQEQLRQRDLAITVQSGSPARDTYSEEKISELIREIDRCMKLLSA